MQHDMYSNDAQRVFYYIHGNPDTIRHIFDPVWKRGNAYFPLTKGEWPCPVQEGGMFATQDQHGRKALVIGGLVTPTVIYQVGVTGLSICSEQFVFDLENNLRITRTKELKELVDVTLLLPRNTPLSREEWNTN